MTPVNALSQDDVSLIRACLDAAVNGPFFPDWEFETLFGLSREQVRLVLAGWPQNAAEAIAEIAVRNALANLRGYSHKQDRLPGDMFRVDRAHLQEVSKTLGAGS